MPFESKAFDQFKELRKKYPEFKKLIEESFQNGTARFFNEEEWNKIESQNFLPPIPEIKSFMDMFERGYNIGNCVNMSWDLSYSYDDVDIVSGVLPILKGTRNAEKEGGHCWLETPTTIIDTTLMLVMDKSLKEKIGYIEEVRIKDSQLRNSSTYQSRKNFVNDRSIRNSKR